VKAIKAGDKVRFDAERVNGQFTLKMIEKAK
jgi:Cu/Ag efflux protein CusF